MSYRKQVSVWPLLSKADQDRTGTIEHLALSRMSKLIVPPIKSSRSLVDHLVLRVARSHSGGMGGRRMVA